MRVSLKKIADGDNEVWQVRYWQNGRYVRKQFKLRSDAVAHRESLEGDCDEAKRMEVPEADRSMVWAAYQRAKAGGYTLVQACDLFEKQLLQRVERKSLKDASEEFLAAKRAKRLRERSLGNLKSRVTHLCVKLGNETPVHDVTLARLQGCIDGKWSARSVINFRLAASNFFGWCVGKRYCVANVGEELEEPLVDQKPPVILTPSEVETMLGKTRTLAPKLIPYIAISVFAGVRNKELQRMTWEDVDLKQSVIRIESHKAKTRARRLVTIQPNLTEWLKLGGDLPPGNLQRLWALVKPERYEVDAMRRTFCSYHLAQFQSAAKTAMEAGHREQVLFAHYRGLVNQNDAGLFWTIYPK